MSRSDRTKNVPGGCSYVRPRVDVIIIYISCGICFYFVHPVTFSLKYSCCMLQICILCCVSGPCFKIKEDQSELKELKY